MPANPTHTRVETRIPPAAEKQLVSVLKARGVSRSDYARRAIMAQVRRDVAAIKRQRANARAKTADQQ